MGTEKIKQGEITYSMFKDAYKDGLISENRRNRIRARFRELEDLESWLKDTELIDDYNLIKMIQGKRYRLRKDYENIYKVGHKEIPLKEKETLTAKEAVQYAVENGFKLSTTTLYKLANEGVIEKHISELGVIGFKPDDVIRICKGRADKHNKPLLSLKKYSDDDLIRELENRKRFKD
jgi:hypothetical protein